VTSSFTSDRHPRASASSSANSARRRCSAITSSRNQERDPTATARSAAEVQSKSVRPPR
jgi:hypothetical protein